MSPFKCLSIFFSSLLPESTNTSLVLFITPSVYNAVLLSLPFSPSFINVRGFLWEQKGTLKAPHAGLRESSPIQCLKTKGGSRLFFFPSSFFLQKSQSTDPMQCLSASSLNVSLFASEDKNSSVEERRDASRLR